jgi:thymidine kinase
MFSGKTTQIIQHYKSYTYIGKKIVVINYAEDKRYHDSLLSTHDQIMIPCILIKKLSDILQDENIKAADIILINEGQFFEDLYPCVQQMLAENKKIYIAGLDGDFERKKFGSLLDLIPMCDKITKLTSLCSICKNGTLGIFSKRISLEKEQTVVGSDNYIPVCRNCYESNQQVHICDSSD